MDPTIRHLLVDGNQAKKAIDNQSHTCIQSSSLDTILDLLRAFDTVGAGTLQCSARSDREDDKQQEHDVVF